MTRESFLGLTCDGVQTKEFILRWLDDSFGIPTRMPAWKDSPGIHQSLGYIYWGEITH